MRSRLFPLPLRAILLGFVLTLTIPGGVRAAEPEVSDGGGFFSEEAVSEATDMILSIQSLYERDVRVETYAEVPEHLKDDLERDGRDKFYDDWLNRRAKELGVRGVFILVTRTPGRIQVGVDKATQRRAFKPADREALRAMLVTAFRAKRYDQGLLDGLRFLRRRLEEDAARDRSPIIPVIGPVAAAHQPVGP